MPGLSRTPPVNVDRALPRLVGRPGGSVSRTVSAHAVRTSLLRAAEIALVDLRDEATFAGAPALRGAASRPLVSRSKRATSSAPGYADRRLHGDAGSGRAAVPSFQARILGYSDVRVLAGGLASWRDSGFELFERQLVQQGFRRARRGAASTPYRVGPTTWKIAPRLAAPTSLWWTRGVQVNTRRCRSTRAPTCPGAELVLRAGDVSLSARRR